MRSAQDSLREVQNVSRSWNEKWRSPAFRVHFLASLLLLVATLHLFTRFLIWVEAREGVTLNDPILQFIKPRDFTWWTFGIIYAAVIVAVLYLVRRPHDLLLAIQSYTLMVFIRAVMMFLVPFAPSEGLIVLRDPFVQLAGDGTAPTKDLFFSGHTATLFLLCLVLEHRTVKLVYLLAAVLVAVFVVLQHVHYVIDVVVAPFVAYACYRIVRMFHQRYLMGK